MQALSCAPKPFLNGTAHNFQNIIIRAEENLFTNVIQHMHEGVKGDE